MGWIRVGLASFGAFSTGTFLSYHLLVDDVSKKGSIFEETVPPELHLSKPLRALNQIGGDFSTVFQKTDSTDLNDVHNLVEQMRQNKSNSLTNNGGERVEEVMRVGVERLTEAYNNQEVFAYSSFGKFVYARDLGKQKERMQSTIKYVEDHPEILNRPPIDDNNGLLVVTGLHRTGSTLMQNLLAQDPNARTPYSYEGLSTVEERKEKEKYIKHQLEQLEFTEQLIPNWLRSFRKYHDFQWTKPEEDCLIMDQILPNPRKYFVMFPSTDVLDWWKKEQRTLGWYQSHYLHLYLKVLDHEREQETGSLGRKHWMTKNPDHSNYLTELIEEFPKANIIITHRHPDRVVGSWAKFQVLTQFPYYHNDSDCANGHLPPVLKANSLFGERCLHHMAVASDNLVGHREHIAKTYPELSARIYDVDWKTFMANPIDEVKKIYKHFGYEYTEEFDTNLKNYLEENRRYKLGKVKYSLEEFKLSALQVREAMKWYIETYDEKF